MKRSPIHRKPPKDPVTPEMREAVMSRDRGCIAPLLDPSQSGTCYGALTLDHVRTHSMMGKRAPSDRKHLVTLCFYHHVLSIWAVTNRPLLRAYLYDVEP
jgi:hypothetical protein